MAADIFCERFEVLHDGGEMALVSCTGEASQAKSFKAVVRFDVRELHLDFFTENVEWSGTSSSRSRRQNHR